MSVSRRPPRVALVYPPFGPKGIPNLGLANLSAGLKRRGFDCRTFYWNLDTANSLPVEDLHQRLDLYQALTRGMAFPFNEWVFSGIVFPEEPAQRAAEVQELLGNLDAKIRREHDLNIPTVWPRSLLPGEAISFLRGNAVALVEAIADRVEGFDVIGINTTFYQNLPALALAKIVKARWPEKWTVLGGANCDDEMGGALIESFDFLDFVFSGEVDHSFPEFVSALATRSAMEEIAGLYYRDQEGQVAAGPRASPVQDMETLPVPDYDDYVLELERTGHLEAHKLVLALESSRGCWWGAKHHCTFCGLNANGMGYRHKSLPRFQREVEEVASRYDARFFFMADNILSIDYYNDFMDWAQEQDFGIDFFYEIKANVTRKHVAQLSKAGVTFVQPGIESFSSRILAMMRKGVRGIQNVAFLKYSREYGVISVYNILAAFPGEDPAEYALMESEISKLVHLRPPSGVVEIEYHRFSPYHKTPEAFGIRLRPSPKYSLLYPLPEEELARLAYLFVRADEDGRARPYIDRLRAAVLTWQRNYDETVCSLTWKNGGDEIIIRDRRPGFRQCNYRLRKYAVPVFYSLDKPLPQSAVPRIAAEIAAQGELGEEAPDLLGELSPAVVRSQTRSSARGQVREFLSEVLTEAAAQANTDGERVIEFDREEFTAEPQTCLRALVEAGLVWVEDDWLLSLPIAEDRRRAVADWFSLSI